ncbi:hypothetical protein N1851_022059 [Merluccius polli]|uniref:Reverse transcriptase domain-containing protein n=1 Tax=Merluccius polli TaxID=89951 RepID=A0AA47MIW4_MERPO|nr:hypothetical protein N1851_022059 [Merluccius polli]
MPCQAAILLAHSGRPAAHVDRPTSDDDKVPKKRKKKKHRRRGGRAVQPRGAQKSCSACGRAGAGKLSERVRLPVQRTRCDLTGKSVIYTASPTLKVEAFVNYHKKYNICDSLILPECLSKELLYLTSELTSNDYRPVALTSHLMKSLERLVLSLLRPLVSSSLDPLQFAYQPRLGVEDTIIFLHHRACAHLDRPGSTVSIMFLDFSSAFNTIRPALLGSKLMAMQVDPSHWAKNTEAVYKKGQS